MANITQDDEWVMERGIIAKMYMTPRQIKSYREGRWIEGIHYKKHSPNPSASEGRATLLYNYTRINRLVGDT
ncbi:excisionase family protein [Klebsiella oxytoca]|uniref:excisionase family protein n=1 Tax=Klebsiella oxytoca TaxID=571 RepID=UPI001F410650|nr:excisionase family protein [Klebsiella oxytoca]MCE5367011.1 excisionase family protein [Klebsiella oxytoca]